MKIYVDSNIVRHAATKYRTMDIYFGGAKPGQALVRYGPIEVLKKKPADDKRLRKEIKLLKRLSKKIKKVGSSLVMDRQTFLEIKRAGRFRSDYFFGSEIEFSNPPPVQYYLSFVPSWMNTGPTDNQFHNFLSTLKHPRFMELAKYAGALQGKRKKYNQLADAYWLWCAESNQCNYFLTLDTKLINSFSTAKRLTFMPILVTPSELLKRL